MELPPQINLKEVPHEDLTIARDVQSTLDRLGLLVSDMAATYDLAQHCAALIPLPPPYDDAPYGIIKRAEASRRFGPWKTIAYKHGALIIYDFYQVMQKNDGVWPKSTWLKERVEHTRLGESSVLFDKAFPEFGLLRNAAAHAGEFGLMGARRQGDAVSGGVDINGFVVGGGITLVSGGDFWRPLYIHGRRQGRIVRPKRKHC